MFFEDLFSLGQPQTNATLTGAVRPLFGGEKGIEHLPHLGWGHTATTVAYGALHRVRRRIGLECDLNFPPVGDRLPGIGQQIDQDALKL
jgi:hypothetical protein